MQTTQVFGVDRGHQWKLTPTTENIYIVPHVFMFPTTDHMQLNKNVEAKLKMRGSINQKLKAS